MEIHVNDFGDIGTRVTLVGKLDIAAAEKIATPMATVAGARSKIVVDMAGVSFISSIGIRHLVMAAKAAARRSGKLVLLAPNPVVTDALVHAGLEDLLPIVRSEDEAREALGRPAGA
jgi:anti-anti-sigma factor